MDIEKLRNKITDILIKHSITECPRCRCTLECPDLDTEDALISLLKELGLGTGVPLKVPENPYKDVNWNAPYASEGFNEAIQKFLEENKEGFEPL